MAHQNRRGFTLVELLIVITIIGMLMAIALPGVLGVIETFDRAACSNKMTELAKAFSTMESSSKNGYPGYIDEISLENGNSKVVIGWPAAILNNIGQKPVHDSIRKGRYGFSKSAKQTTLPRPFMDDGEGTNSSPPYIDDFVCPTAGMEKMDVLNYIVNCGRQDTGGGSGGGGNSNNKRSPDKFFNGIFHNKTSKVRKTKVTLGDLGAKKTLMLSESLGTDMVGGTTTSWTATSEAELGMVWWPEEGKNISPQEKKPGIAPANDLPLEDATDINMARPFSLHTAGNGGFNVVYANLTPDYLSTSISYRVYCKLMVIDGELARRNDKGVPSWISDSISDTELHQ